MRDDTIYVGYLGGNYVMMLPKTESTTRYYVDPKRSTATHNCIPWDHGERRSVLNRCDTVYQHLKTVELEEASLTYLITLPQRNIKVTLIRKEIQR